MRAEWQECPIRVWKEVASTETAVWVRVVNYRGMGVGGHMRAHAHAHVYCVFTWMFLCAHCDASGPCLVWIMDMSEAWSPPRGCVLFSVWVLCVETFMQEGHWGEWF